MFVSKDLGTANGLPSPVTIKNLFGSIANAQLAVNPEYNSVWTKESAFKALTKWVKENGRMFVQRDLGTVNGLPSYNTIKKLFGSFPNAQSAIKSNLSF